MRRRDETRRTNSFVGVGEDCCFDSESFEGFDWIKRTRTSSVREREGEKEDWDVSTQEDMRLTSRNDVVKDPIPF